MTDIFHPESFAETKKAGEQIKNMRKPKDQELNRKLAHCVCNRDNRVTTRKLRLSNNERMIEN